MATPYYRLDPKYHMVWNEVCPKSDEGSRATYQATSQPTNQAAIIKVL